jgi:hypothetical protein
MTWTLLTELMMLPRTQGKLDTQTQEAERRLGQDDAALTHRRNDDQLRDDVGNQVFEDAR